VTHSKVQVGSGAQQSDMPEDVFAAISKLAHDEAGLMIPASKHALVQSRISRRLRALGMTDFNAYLRLVHSDAGGGERRNMISALTTNVSAFFREGHHFETLSGMATSLIERARSGEKVRIWSAGCSSGQEPFSIAMTLLEADGRAGAHDIRILATDIDPAVLDVARKGFFDESQMAGVSHPLREQYFIASSGGRFGATDVLRRMISFRELNLLGHWPMKGRFHAIFCRNVVIYFDESTQAALWPRFRRALLDNGLLFVGHSERVPNPGAVGFRPAGVTTFTAVATTSEETPGGPARTHDT